MKKILSIGLSCLLFISVARADEVFVPPYNPALESAVLSGSALSIATVTAKTITSIALTQGDWDISGAVSFQPANTTTVTLFLSCISLTDNTLDTTPGRVASPPISSVTYGPSTTVVHVPTPTFKLSVGAAGTTVYLIAYSAFTVSTQVAFGMIHARRAGQ